MRAGRRGGDGGGGQEAAGRNWARLLGSINWGVRWGCGGGGWGQYTWGQPGTGVTSGQEEEGEGVHSSWWGPLQWTAACGAAAARCHQLVADWLSVWPQSQCALPVIAGVGGHDDCTHPMCGQCWAGGSWAAASPSSHPAAGQTLQVRTLPKGPVCIRSTSWYSLLPENSTSFTSMDHLRSSARSSSSCTAKAGTVIAMHAGDVASALRAPCCTYPEAFSIFSHRKMCC
jgi:hypothetical protein